ncbi:PREDICTED: UDP-glycosyltransferase [Prunus dulcis]|nr:PREDICTED: UDP-glycosyltransferase [Prunus dulcis]
MELCKQLASRNFKAVFVISSNLSSSVPSSLRQFPLVQIAEIPDEIPPPSSSGSSPLPQPSSGPPRPHHDHHNQMGVGLEKLLSTRSDNPDSATPICAVLDVMVGWNAEIFKKFGIPTVAFFTSGACSAAMEYAMWKAQPLDIKSGETRLLPGLPEEMALTLSDLKQHSREPPPPIHGGSPPPGAGAGFPPPGPPLSGHSDGPPLSLGGNFPPHGLPPPLGPGADFPPPDPPFGGPGQQRRGPPKPGGRPPWVDEADRSIALMINTCDDLERPFIEYLAKQIGKPVWGVGPLLPEQYWKSDGSVLRDGKLRTSNRRSNISEDEVIEWLDSKSKGSVLYVSFGSEVGPTVEEFSILAEALEASNRPFIWVVQSGSGRPPGPPHAGSKAEEGYFPHGLAERVGKRGLIIHGWAPQLLILSHPSTGGFLSHCGWNSTVEAIGRGVPFLAWPIRGDQHHDAKLVVSFLKVGYRISDEISEKIKKDDIVKGIEMLMDDEDMKQRAVRLSAKFEHGFPTSSVAALDAFRDFVAQKAA